LSEIAEQGPAHGALKRDAFLHACAGLGLTVAIGGAAAHRLGLTPSGIAVAAAIFAAFIGFLLIWLREHSPHRRLGAANRITIFRAALVANLAAMAVYDSVPAMHGWFVTALMIFAYALDGVDGWAARRFALSSRFGARLDQELDALFTLVLALAIYQMGKAEWWILIAGAWHYAFHGLRSASPVFRKTLPFSQRRRAICAVTVAALIACASPLFQPPLSEMLAFATVAMLSASFAIDIFWLLRLK
jgi:phosphatidylglycerophosphate synthase